MKTHKITLNNIKDSDTWNELIYVLKFDSFKTKHPELDEEMDEDELNDLFYKEVISKTFQYGEFASIELIIDENLKVIDGKILPIKNNK